MPIKTAQKMGDIADLVGSAWIPTARNGAKHKLTARICADVNRKEKGNGTAGLLSHHKNYRMAIGLPGEPVAPLRRSGAKLKANS